ncbi:MAG TPA: hypothetical protein QF353_05830 [Gammaproteobacteria bacterium]|nr:hypothetical protein [Gammaproteobacteria bacterium]
MQIIKYYHQKQLYSSRFNHEQAFLWVYQPGRGYSFALWGRRPREACDLPCGAIVDRQELLQGVWDIYCPSYVAIQLDSFLIRGLDNRCYWFKVSQGNVLLGLQLNSGNIKRIYCVVENILRPTTFIYWPRFVWVEAFNKINVKKPMNI